MIRPVNPVRAEGFRPSRSDSRVISADAALAIASAGFARVVVNPRVFVNDKISPSSRSVSFASCARRTTIGCGSPPGGKP